MEIQIHQICHHKNHRNHSLHISFYGGFIHLKIHHVSHERIHDDDDGDDHEVGDFYDGRRMKSKNENMSKHGQ